MHPLIYPWFQLPLPGVFGTLRHDNINKLLSHWIGLDEIVPLLGEKLTDLQQLTRDTVQPWVFYKVSTVIMGNNGAKYLYRLWELDLKIFLQLPIHILDFEQYTNRFLVRYR